MAKQSEWPRIKREPESYFAGPDGYHRSDREVAGPLRMGTTPEVGPKGPAVKADRSSSSDFGMDRIDGTAGHDINKGTKEPPPPYKSDLIAQFERGRTRKE
ncbi:MAG TPA: hypothetical protein VHT52_01690 [Stellaceae bacterium]|jgi:hypothetical protein|nr:hypothetical protein [Stellaceae bacterium]